MKTRNSPFLLVLVIVFVFVSVFPVNAKNNALPYMHGNLLEGQWEYLCDEAGINVFEWESTIGLGSIDIKVSINFKDWDIVEGASDLAFRIYSDEYPLTWLYITKEGEYIPDITFFNESDLMGDYIGGYPAFRRSLDALEIDWAVQYIVARREFLLLYGLFDTDACHLHQEYPPFKLLHA